MAKKVNKHRDEPIPRLLKIWRKSRPGVYKVSLRRLWEDLRGIASRNNVRFPQATNQGAFRKKLIRLMPAMEEDVNLEINGTRGKPSTVRFLK